MNWVTRQLHVSDFEMFRLFERIFILVYETPIFTNLEERMLRGRLKCSRV